MGLNCNINTEFNFPTKLKTASVRYPKGTMTKSTKEIYKISTDRRYAPKGIGSAIQWLQYFLNRGGKGIPDKQRKRIEKAKKMLQVDLRKKKSSRKRRQSKDNTKKNYVMNRCEKNTTRQFDRCFFVRKKLFDKCWFPAIKSYKKCIKKKLKT